MTIVGLLALWALVVVADDQIDAAVDDGLRTRSGEVVRSLTTGEPIVDPLAQLLDPSRRVVTASPGLTTAPLIDDAQLAAALDRPTIVEVTGELRVHTTPLDGNVVVVASRLEDLETARYRLAVLATVAMGLLVGAVSVVSWFVVGASLIPVRHMTEAAELLGHDIGPRRLPPPRTGDELDDLASTLNGMLDRLSLAVERERAFVDDASHDLRTPLTLLRGELELALDEPNVDDIRDGVRRALSAAERLSGLADNLLVLARLDGGEHPRLEPLPLQPWLFTAVSRLSGLGSADLTTHSPDITVAVDPAMVERALSNLIVNANAAGARRIEVSATTHRSPTGPALLSIVVADDGPGFSARILPTATERFSRAHAARGSGGAGLGLAIVAAVARAHGGTLAVGNGSPLGGAQITFTVQFGSEGVTTPGEAANGSSIQ